MRSYCIKTSDGTLYMVEADYVEYGNYWLSFYAESLTGNDKLVARFGTAQVIKVTRGCSTEHPK